MDRRKENNENWGGRKSRMKRKEKKEWRNIDCEGIQGFFS